MHNSMVPNGYNILEGGQGCSGFKHSNETKARLSEISKKRAKDPEIHKKQVEALQEYWKKPENRKAQSNRLKNSENHKTMIKTREAIRTKENGGKQSEATKNKISEGLKNYYKNKENHELSSETKKKIGKAQEKPVVQYDLDGNILGKFKSTKEASEVLEISSSAISNALRGKIKTSGGFVWKFDTKTA